MSSPELRRPGWRLPRGFTLVELMVVVIIMSILALIGMGSFKKHVDDARINEAVAMVRSIAAAQVQYRAEHGSYLNVSGALNTFHPLAEGAVGATEQPFYLPVGDGTSVADRWRELAPKAPNLVSFSYATIAGLPGAGAPGGFLRAVGWPTTVVEPWYVVQAVGAPDGSSNKRVIIATSFNSQLYQD